MNGVKCECGFRIWDGEVVRSRVLRLMPSGQFEAKCRCKRWVAVPCWLRPPGIEAGKRRAAG